MIHYNSIAYLLFLGLMSLVIVKIGRICYDNGNIFVATLIPDHKALCLQINKALLTGYYLLNIGYCAITITNWQTITTLSMLIEVIAIKAATILFLLAALHYTNLFLLKNYVQKLIQ
ncbi:hypothetical protein [Flavobacterium sp.]|uniref:hypothetical protein n=1 Tax=Flavobacterium sp. TaxID=239 RepID=UPI00262154EE|nr:hypothetical protein [Flavobacterium sp.]